MTEPESSENGYQRMRPRLPLWIAITSILVAIGSVSVLVLVLYEETKGPAEILREFARRLDRGDCAGSFDLLHPSITGVQAGAAPGLTEQDWCDGYFEPTDADLDADFHLERAVLSGDQATVYISNGEEPEWLLERKGSRSWRILGPASTGPYIPPP